MPTTRGVPRWSPSQVLTAPDAAWLRWSDENRYFQHGMAVGRQLELIILYQHYILAVLFPISNDGFRELIIIIFFSLLLKNIRRDKADFISRELLKLYYIWYDIYCIFFNKIRRQKEKAKKKKAVFCVYLFILFINYLNIVVLLCMAQLPFKLWAGLPIPLARIEISARV